MEIKVTTYKSDDKYGCIISQDSANMEESILQNNIKKKAPTAGPNGQPRGSRYQDPLGSGEKPAIAVATQDRVFPHYVPNSSIKHSKSDSKDRSQEIL
jgi:hypothetical protein